MGAVGSIVVWRSIDRGAVLGESVSGSNVQIAEEREGDGTEPNTIGIRATEPSGRGGRRRGERKRSDFAAGDFWRRGLGDGELASLAGTARGGAAAVGEYVWDHGDDRTCDLPTGHAGARGGECECGRRADTRFAVVCIAGRNVP